MAQPEMISFDKEKLKMLKKDYQSAVDNNVESFVFDGHELLVSYAKHMIEYLEGKLGEA